MKTGRSFLFLFLVCLMRAVVCRADPAADYWNSCLNEQDPEKAIGQFEELIQKFPSSQLSADAQYAIGENCYLTGNYPKAYTAFKIFVDKFPRHKNVSTALYNMGLCSTRQGEQVRAVREFRQVASLFPQSKEATLAKIGVAEVYFSNREYSQALREYRWLPSEGDLAPHILYKMYFCYTALNNKRYAEYTLKQLMEKYPESIQAKNVQPTLSEQIVGTAKLLQGRDMGEEIREEITEEIAVSETREKDPEQPLTPSLQNEFTIQIGSFTKRLNALTITRNLRNKNYFSWIQPVKIEGSVFYRVYVGKYTDREEAQKQAGVLQKEYDLSTLVVTLDKQ